MVLCQIVAVAKGHNNTICNGLRSENITYLLCCPLVCPEQFKCIFTTFVTHATVFYEILHFSTSTSFKSVIMMQFTHYTWAAYGKIKVKKLMYWKFYLKISGSRSNLCHSGPSCLKGD